MQIPLKDKTELRKAIRSQIRELDPEFVRESNELVYRRVTEGLIEYVHAETVFCFIGTNMEIDTAPIIRHALRAGKTVVIPHCLGEGTGIMKACRIYDIDDLVIGAYGIREPRPNSVIIEPREIDTALVPCLSCDRNCKRLGQGGGYYDRFMEGRRFFTAALCREILMLDNVPVEPWDLSVDAVVTEERIYTSKQAPEE